MTRRPLATLAIAFVVLGLFGYGLFEARKLIEGPVITIDSPRDGTATSSAAITIAGNAQNISFLSINGKPAFADEQGRFAELLSVAPGFTILTVAATDRFGRSESRSVSITVLNYCAVNSG